MALLDPSDDGFARHARSDQQPTTHPRLCLLGGFGFIIAAALAVHVVFNVLI
jgi:hypothetical protein